MNLLDIRKLLVKLSGRHDLVVDTTDYVDNGADVFIQEGSRFLDRKITTVNDGDSAFVSVKQGAFQATFAEARVIKEVWFYADGTRVQLRELVKERIRELFPKILAGTEQGVPAVYATYRGNINVGSAPIDFLSRAKVTDTDINGIIFAPIDRAGTIEVVGKFYSLILETNGDENYWSVNHPMLLVWAALYHLEISYRNTTGAKDWLAAVMDTLTSIEMDHVEEASFNLRQMGGRENE